MPPPPPPLLSSSTSSEPVMKAPSAPRGVPDSSKAPLKNAPPNAPPLKYQKPSWSGFPNQQFYFEVIKNGVIIEEIMVPEKQFLVIGRLPFCDLEMEHPVGPWSEYIIPYHAVVQFKSNGEAFIYDLNSSHGTRLNKNKIPPGVHVSLKPGDQLRFGESTRLYLFQTKEEIDREEEERELVQQKIRQQKRLGQDEPEEEQNDFDWGMKEDAVEEEDGFMDDNFRQKVDENAYYRSDPKKALRNYLEGRGYAYEVELEESGPGHARVYTARIRLPLESAIGPVYGEATTGKKKDAEREAALDACIKLDSRGMLRTEQMGSSSSSNATGRSSRRNDDDDDDDDFYDRTVKKKRNVKKESQQVDSHETLLVKHSRLKKEIEELESKIKAVDAMEAERKRVEQENDLDAYMALLEKSKGDSKGKLLQDLAVLRKEENRLLKLIELTKPIDYAAKLGGASSNPPKPSHTSDSIAPKRQLSPAHEGESRDTPLPEKRARVIGPSLPPPQ
ncbi:Kanadaptin [Actinomortierella wolfii]|nr:Kanadaptin [Actinomortierella wolfii]